MITGFKLIQKIGIKGMDFKSTNGYTLEFDEAKSIALLVINEIRKTESSPAIIQLEKELENAKLIFSTPSHPIAD